jgi:hypothetical protein
VLHGGVDGDERRLAVRSLVGHGGSHRGSHRANHMSQLRMPAPTGHRGPPHPRASVGHASFRSSSAIGHGARNIRAASVRSAATASKSPRHGALTASRSCRSRPTPRPPQ